MGAALAELPVKVPEIRTYAYGGDAGRAAGNSDFAVTATFDTAENWATYRDHPDHCAVIAELITPWLGERAAVQFEPPRA